MNPETIARLSAPVPRYTSYPTAPHFHDGIGESEYRNWLARLPHDEAVSLYVHIPFCDRLCWFCACHTKQIKRYHPIARYLTSLHKEVGIVAEAAGFRPSLRALHLGGGSPSLLREADLLRLRTSLEDRFRFGPETEVSIEIDPSDTDDATIDALKAFGITRASIGVQDFDETVQRVINRPQSFAQTSATVAALREAGVQSVNIDVLYGLPYQSVETVKKTMGQVSALRPDRIALFGYAHVPWMKKHQRLLPEEHLPGSVDRYQQSQAAAELLIHAGYTKVGIDHFALPTDPLAEASGTTRLRRNFQGYTDDPCATLIGLGASSIGKLQQGYVQNEVATGLYMRAVDEGRLPIVRGVALTDTDRLHADIVENLMCQFQFRLSEIRKGHGQCADAIADHAALMCEQDEMGLVRFDGDQFVIRSEARPFARVVASWFDARMQERKAQHSAAI